MKKVWIVGLVLFGVWTEWDWIVEYGRGMYYIVSAEILINTNGAKQLP